MIATTKEFGKWVKIRLIEQDKTQRNLAEEIGISYPRISEAVHGKSAGRRHVKAIIKGLGGNIEDFNEFLDKAEGHESNNEIPGE